MRHLSYKVFFKFLLASAIATIVSLVITMIVSRYIPEVHGVKNSIGIRQEQIFTQEQLDEAQRSIEDRINILKEDERNRSRKESIQNIKSYTIYFSWFPWLIVPFLLTIRYWLWGTFLLSIPVILVPTGMFLFVEIIIFGICLYLGHQIRNNFIKEKGAVPDN